VGDSNGAPVRRSIDVDAPAVLLTTSGTTSQPKVVIHTLATLGKIAQSFAHWDLDIDQTAAIAVDPQSSTLKDIRRHLAERLADYKIPEKLTIVTKIPRNALGKIDRKLLLSMA
jgi:acyl-coenzyme A synthetase/AMP-(fatty) acid ligase